MKKLTKVLSVLLAICYIFSVPQTASAESAYRFEDEALKLHKLGLFAGAYLDRFNPDLGADLNRQVGITLLLNFFGKRAEVAALSANETNRILSPFQDQAGVADWARPYMAYAVKTGMVVGTSSATPTLGYSDPLDGVSYAAMILRQLGYTVNRQDFTKSIIRLYEKGAINSWDVNYFEKPQLIKDDAIGMVYGSLFATGSDGSALIDKLIESKAVSRDVAVLMGVIKDEANDIIPVDFSHRTNSRPSGYNEAYFQVLDALKNQKESIKIVQNEYTDTFEEVVEIVDRCVKENPEILYYNGFSYSTQGEVAFKYRKDAETNRRHSLLLEQKIESVVKELITPSMTDYQKELAIHDYLIENCEYDVEGYESGKIEADSFNAYGALCLGVAVCEGYAEAAALLLNRAGVETLVITGDSRGEKHAWNIVKIDGDYYHLDVTWNDPVQQNSISTIKYYDYFNLTDKEIGKDHSWDKEKYVSCTAEKYNYYIYNNLIVKSRDEFISRVVEEVQKGNKNIVLKFKLGTGESFKLDNAINDIVNRLYLRCQYRYNGNLKLVSLSFH
jgi:transglutaminase-like putative cysteine protease